MDEGTEMAELTSDRPFLFREDKNLAKGLISLVVLVSISTLVLYATAHDIISRHKHKQNQKVEEHYQILSQEEVIRPYDTNNNGLLESEEMKDLFRDYQLSKR